MGTTVASITPKRGLFGAARDVTDVLLGGPTRENESNPTITTSVSSVLGNNPDRVGLIFINVGINDVYLALNSQVSTTNGIKLAALGGSATLTVRDDFTLSSRQWYAVSNSANSTLYILELISDIYTPKAEQ